MTLKRLRYAVIFILFICFSLLSNTYAQIDNKILDFDTKIIISKDGSIKVTEKIKYLFTEQNHGITRRIPLVTKNQDGDAFLMSAQSISVTTPLDFPYRYKNISTEEEINLQIGNPNETISGIHTYIIKYTVLGALRYFTDHDELYWNVTGDGWDVPIEHTTTKIIFPSIDGSATTLACFTNTDGGSDQNCMTYKGTSEFKTTRRLEKDEQLTITFGFPKGKVEVLEPTKTFKSQYSWILMVAISIAAGLYYAIVPVRYIIKGIKKLKPHPNESKTVAAWFEPPETSVGRPLTAGEAGVLIDKKGDIKDISASLVQLAQKGYINIGQKDKGTFYFNKLKKLKNDNNINEAEKHLLTSMFGNEDQVTTRELSNNKFFYSDIHKFFKLISNRLVEDKIFDENPYTMRNKWLVSLVLSVITFNILFIIASILMMRSAKRSEDGSLAYAVLKSLKNFVLSQDKQLKFQAKNQIMFEKLLPYAISLGVEKVWVKRFKNIALKQPKWMDSKSPLPFKYSSFVGGLGKSVSGAAKMSSNRSSTGHSSGFSGGSAGGGGGGGGGGSW